MRPLAHPAAAAALALLLGGCPEAPTPATPSPGHSLDSPTPTDPRVTPTAPPSPGQGGTATPSSTPGDPEATSPAGTPGATPTASASPPATPTPRPATPTPRPATPTPRPTPDPTPTLAGQRWGYCQPTCDAVSDCTSASPLNDADNYVCDEVCQWQGCQGDGECVAAQGAGYACADVYGFGLPSCVERCAVAADCATAIPANDADNYACDDGLCRWTGCHSALECVQSYGAGYTCGAPSGGLSYCVPSCARASDCALDTGAYGSDNYACEGGACEWQGCSSDRECQLTFQDAGWVCVGI